MSISAQTIMRHWAVGARLLRAAGCCNRQLTTRVDRTSPRAYQHRLLHLLAVNGPLVAPRLASRHLCKESPRPSAAIERCNAMNVNLIAKIETAADFPADNQTRAPPGLLTFREGCRPHKGASPRHTYPQEAGRVLEGWSPLTLPAVQ